jgi:hypothetical protein
MCTCYLLDYDFIVCFLSEEERIVAEEKLRVQTLKDELRDKTHRVNNLEV